MKIILTGMAIALVGCSTASQRRTTPVTPQPVASTQPSATPTPVAPGPAPTPVAQATAEPADNGLNDLAAVTFGCPKAALNAAAREAAKVQSQGTYQFAYYAIASDSHHAAYEVHFKSNYQGEPLLRYCVAIYCQQGWDPKTTQAAVTLMPEPTQHAKKGDPDAGCGGKHNHIGARKLE